MALVSRNDAARLTRNVRSQAASLIASMLDFYTAPTLLTSTARLPAAAITAASGGSGVGRSGNVTDEVWKKYIED